MVGRRTLLAGLAGVGALAGLAGCSAGGSSAHEAGEAERVLCVRYRIGRPAAIDPLFVEDEAGCVVVSQLFDTLLRFDSATGGFALRAASGFTVSEDATTVTFTLQPNRTFHNGEPVNASAFKRAWERLVRPLPTPDEAKAAEEAGAEEVELQHGASAALLKLVNGYDALYGGTASELVGLRCPDDLTLVVELTAPCAEWAYVTACPVMAPVPAAALEDPEAFATEPIGNGPFRMKEPWESKKELHLAAFDAYAPGKATVDGVLFSLEPSTSTAYKQFRAGNLDVCDVPVGQFDDAEEAAGVAEDGRTMGPGARLVHQTEPGLLYVACNTALAPFNMPALRQALALAIDGETLCKKTLAYSYAQALTPVPPCVAGAEQPAWASSAYDPDRASELLEESYPADEAGVRSLQIELTYRKGGVQDRVATQIAGDLKDVGITVKKRPLEADELAAAYALGDYELGLAAWMPDVPSMGSFVSPLLHGEARTEPDPQNAPSALTNISGYVRAEVDDLIDRARTALDESARRDLYAQALAYVGEDLPIIPLAHPTHTKVASDRMTHLVIGADGVPELAHAVL